MTGSDDSQSMASWATHMDEGGYVQPPIHHIDDMAHHTPAHAHNGKP